MESEGLRGQSKALFLTVFTREGSHDDAVEWSLINAHSSFKDTASG